MKYIHFGPDPAKRDAWEIPSTWEEVIPPQQVTHCCTGYYYSAIPQKSVDVACVRWQICSSTWQSSCLKFKEQKFLGKGSFRGSNFSKTHHPFDTVMLLVILHVLKSLPDAGGRVSPTSNTCSVFTPLFCSPEAPVSTPLFPFSLPPFPSCILLIIHRVWKIPSVQLYRATWEIKPPNAWKGTWNYHGWCISIEILLPTSLFLQAGRAELCPGFKPTRHRWTLFSTVLSPS